MLAITSILQLGVVAISGSVALLADAIHNVGDAATAIPLWIAFMLARRKTSTTFTYGLGRVEDLAGVIIVGIILFSAVFAGYEAIDRLIHPQSIDFIPWVVAAGIIGFIGNEAVTVFRILVGREINSVALVADGYHARTDGFTSLAVVAGAIGVWLGFPLADPVVGLLITIAIFGIVWQSSKAVFVRMLDGVDPAITDEIIHTVEHIKGVRRILEVKARWLGHRLLADIGIQIDADMTMADADRLADNLKHEMFEHVLGLSVANIRVSSRFDGNYKEQVRGYCRDARPSHDVAADGYQTRYDGCRSKVLTVAVKRSPGSLPAPTETARVKAHCILNDSLMPRLLGLLRLFSELSGYGAPSARKLAAHA